MSRDLDPGLQDMLDSGVSTTCFCWRIDRKDGVTMGFTDHDVDITIGNVVYEHTTSFTGSAMESQLGLAVSNMDVMGALSSDSITEDDLECGRYDGALLTILLVNWQNAAQNGVIMSGPLGQVTIGDLAYQAELRSLAQAFAQYVGSLCQANCRTNFGDTGFGLEGGCNFALPDPVPATVTGVTDRTKFTVSAVGSFPPGTRGSLAGGYFSFGFVTFNGTSANKGVAREINASDETIIIQVFEPFPDDIAIGDTCLLQIGCDKTVNTCFENYDNVVNFRGEPYVPGTDQVFKVNGEGG